MEWCDSVSNMILDILKDNPEHKFLITGYAANFNNEIDSDVLALERADNIKKELVNVTLMNVNLQLDTTIN